MTAISTPRLICSQICADDWPFFLALQQDAEVMRYVSDPRSEEEIRAAFDARLPAWAPGAAHWLCLTVRERRSGLPLGVTGYVHREADCAEAGFLFSRDAQGKGYGGESLQALCRYGFGEGGLRRMTATVTAGNAASRRVLEKSGFRLEGELRESYRLAGVWRNDWLFGLLAHEFEQVPR